MPQLEVQEHSCGTVGQHPDFVFFFGNVKSSVDAVNLQFSSLPLAHIHQIHGTDIIQQFGENQHNDQLMAADAHWTDCAKLGLVIRTADCMPIFIYSPRPKRIAAIHAGWRGLSLGIVGTCLKSQFAEHSNPNELRVIVGPHIGMDSFEVDAPAKDQLIASIEGIDSWHKKERQVFRQNNDKFYISLLEVLKLQLAHFKIPSENIYFFGSDTKTNTNYHSYRRDSTRAGRQISLIYLTL